MADHSSMKLGKQAVRHDARTLRLARYTTALPDPPSSIDWSGQLSNLGVMLNDSLGDCTCAAIGHIVQTWTSQTQDQQVILSDQDILTLYEQSCGYDPDDPSTDQGGIELDVLNYWRKNPVVGHSLDAFCAIQPGDIKDIQNGVWLFGAVYIGLALPITAQTQDVWDLGDLSGNGAPGSWGGHAVCVVSYDETGLTCITWGQLKRMTWTFWKSYTDEAYALLSPDWIGVSGDAPSGFDMATLTTDLAAI